MVLFAASRLYLLLGFTPDQSDIPWVYQPYVWEHAQAVAHGRPLFAFHAEQFERTRLREQAAGRPGPAEEAHWIEYPPLALRLVVLPALFLPPLAPPPLESWPPGGDIPGYARAFRTTLFVVDVFGFAILLAVVPRLFPREGQGRHFERWFAYIVGGHVLGHLLYDRLTLPTGILMLAATALLMLPRAPILAAFSAWAVAVNYQLSPLVLAPVIALGATPAALFQGPTGGWLRRATPYGLILLALVLLFFAPFYLYEGPASVGLFRFHGDRGVQIEAVASTLPLLLSFFGYPVAPAGEYNSWSLASPLSPSLKALSAPLVCALVAATAWTFATALRRRPAAAPETRAAVAAGPAFAGFVVVAFAAAIAGSKVFSPQYLSWLLPLVPLLPGRSARWLFVLTAVATTIVFPYAYDHVAAWIENPVTRDLYARGPTVWGKVLLVSRNALFVLFAVVAFRSARASAPVS
jgi:hypothetical protein